MQRGGEKSNHGHYIVKISLQFVGAFTWKRIFAQKLLKRSEPRAAKRLTDAALVLIGLNIRFPSFEQDLLHF